MSYTCPVCNGLTNLQSHCTNCHHSLDDYGRLGDVWGPYDPYREIDHIRMTNGYEDLENHQCLHLATCSSCGKDHIIPIQEQLINP